MTVADPCLGHLEGTLLFLPYLFDLSADALGEGGEFPLRQVQDAPLPGEAATCCL